MEGLKCYFLLIALMKDKYPIYNINVDENMASLK